MKLLYQETVDNLVASEKLQLARITHVFTVDTKGVDREALADWCLGHGLTLKYRWDFLFGITNNAEATITANSNKQAANFVANWLEKPKATEPAPDPYRVWAGLA